MPTPTAAHSRVSWAYCFNRLNVENPNFSDILPNHTNEARLSGPILAGERLRVQHCNPMIAADHSASLLRHPANNSTDKRHGYRSNEQIS